MRWSLRRGEDLAGRAELDQLAEIHEGGEVRDARRLLHVVGDDHDRVVGLQLVDQLLDLGGRDRIERRARLVEQDHLGLHRDGAGDAQALLLAAGQAQAVGVELVLDLVPQRGAAQRRLDPAVELGLAAAARRAGCRRRCSRRSTSETASASGTPCRCARAAG